MCYFLDLFWVFGSNRVSIAIALDRDGGSLAMASAPYGEKSSEEIRETYVCSMKKQYSDSPQLSDDNMLDILWRLPSKLLCRFKCVSKQFCRYIAGSGSGLLEFDNCRSQRLKSSPHMMGFFYQNIDLSKRAQIRFLFTSSEDSPNRRRLAADATNIDESVGFLEEGRNVYVIASCKGFLLCCRHIVYPMKYYVYNPATKQWLALPKPPHRHEDVAVGFSCKVDDPDKDLISYTIVRYLIPGIVDTYTLQSTVIVERFSSETSAWTTINIKIGVPHRLFSVDRPAVVIDEVFLWLDKGPQIFAIDIESRYCWLVDLPHEEIGFYWSYYLRVSNGCLYYMMDRAGVFSVWALESHYRCPNAKWLIKFQGRLTNIVEKFPHIFGSVNSIEYIKPVAFHPAYPNILYLDVSKKVISFDLESQAVEVVGELSMSMPSLITEEYRYFPYEWSEWPLLLPALKSI